MAEHAKLSASASKRWLSCTPSAVLESKFPNSTSEAAAEGTLAHNIGELLIRLKSGRMTDPAYQDCMKNQKASADGKKFYSTEMLDYCEEYSDFVVSQFEKAKLITPDAVLEVEQRLDFSQYVEEGFGTGDAIVIADTTLSIIDLKYGKGVRVECEHNTQMMLYALGALNKYGFLYDITRIEMTIYQPRMNNISTFGVDVEQLLVWAEEYLKPKAALAYAGEGEYVCGDHCKFCRARNVCKQLAYENLSSLVSYIDKGKETLDDTSISAILTMAEGWTSWINGITAYAFDQAVNNGKVWPHHKLVEGRSIRSFSDYSLVVDKLKTEGFQEDELWNKKPLGIGDIEKLVGKKQFDPLLSDFVIKPQGKPTLAHESDKRPVLITKQDAASTFAEVEI